MCVVHPSTANGRLGTPCEAEAEEARRTVLISVLSGLGALRANGGGGLMSGRAAGEAASMQDGAGKGRAGCAVLRCLATAANFAGTRRGCGPRASDAISRTGRRLAQAMAWAPSKSARRPRAIAFG